MDYRREGRSKGVEGGMKGGGNNTKKDIYIYECKLKGRRGRV